MKEGKEMSDIQFGNGNPKYFEIYDVDFEKLVKAIDNCQGAVILFDDEGNQFNLKSKLSQMTGLFTLIRGGQLTHAKLYCKDPDDMAMLFRLNLFGEIKEDEQ